MVTKPYIICGPLPYAPFPHQSLKFQRNTDMDIFWIPVWYAIWNLISEAKLFNRTREQFEYYYVPNHKINGDRVRQKLDCPSNISPSALEASTNTRQYCWQNQQIDHGWQHQQGGAWKTRDPRHFFPAICCHRNRINNTRPSSWMARAILIWHVSDELEEILWG
jgi:hypothetical protein